MIKQLYEFTFQDKEHKKDFEEYLYELDVVNWKRKKQPNNKENKK